MEIKINLSGILTKERIYELKEQIIGEVCNNVCGKKGYIIRDGVIENCSCYNKFYNYLLFYNSNIPDKYLDFEFEDLTKSFVSQNEQSLKIIKNYIENVDKAIKEGVGLLIQGSQGLAKTALSILILKNVLLKGYSGFFINFSELISILMYFANDIENNFINFLKNCDLLIIDEFDSEVKSDSSTFHGNLFRKFISYRYSYNKSLIITSTRPKSYYSQKFPDIYDKLKVLIDVVLVGKSHRNITSEIKKIIS